MRILNYFKLLAVILFAILFFGCEKSFNSNAERPTIKIGVLLPQTGSASSAGQSIRAALEYYEYVRLSEKVLRPFYLDFEYFDTETNPEKCLTGIKYFNSKNIKIVIGPYSTAELETIADYVKQNNMIVMSPSSVAVSMAKPDDNIFRFAPNDSIQALAVQKYLEYKNIKYMTGIYRNDVWGADLSKLVSKNKLFDGNFNNNFYGYKTDLTDLNANVDMLNENIKLYKDWLKDIKELALYFASFGEGSDVIEKIVESSIAGHQDLKLIGSSAFAFNSTILGKEKAANYAITQEMVCPVFALPREIDKLPIYTDLAKLIGRNPETYAIVAYDIASLLNSIMTDTNYLQNRDVSQVLSKIIEYSKIGWRYSGNMELNSNGDRKYGNYNFMSIRKNGSIYEWYVNVTYDYESGKIVKY